MHRTSAGKYVAESAGRRTKPFAMPDEAVAAAQKEASTKEAITAAREDAAARGLTGQEAMRDVDAAMKARDTETSPSQPPPTRAKRKRQRAPMTRCNSWLLRAASGKSRAT